MPETNECPSCGNTHEVLTFKLPPWRVFEVALLTPEGQVETIRMTSHAYDVTSPAGHLIFIDFDTMGRTWHRKCFNASLWKTVTDLGNVQLSKVN